MIRMYLVSLLALREPRRRLIQCVLQLWTPNASVPCCTDQRRTSSLQQLAARYPNVECFTAGKFEREPEPIAAIVGGAHYHDFLSPVTVAVSPSAETTKSLSSARSARLSLSSNRMFRVI
jgi:hypothetical protein